MLCFLLLFLTQGTELKYWPNGKLRSSVEMETFEGEILAHGIEKQFSEHGRLVAEIHWQQGRKHGPFRRWFCDGTLIESGFFLDGDRQGLFETWYPNGRLYNRISWQKGQADGLQQVFWTNGAKLKEINWVAGRQVDSTFWDQNGMPIPDGEVDSIDLQTPDLVLPKLEQVSPFKFKGLACGQEIASIVFEADFTPDGRVTNLHIMAGSRPYIGYNEALWAYLSKLSFKPGRLKGALVRVRMTYSIRPDIYQ